jgi:hypothetical protein
MTFSCLFVTASCVYMCVHSTLSRLTDFGRGKTYPMNQTFFSKGPTGLIALRRQAMPAVLSFSVLFFGPNREFYPGAADFQEEGCHEECTTEFGNCWDNCDPDDLDCHDECVVESDRCDDLCDHLDDFDPWDNEGSNQQVDYETCATVCDDRFDACFEACDGNEHCEEQCEDVAVECDTSCIEAVDWTPEDWQELEKELRNK